MDCLDSTGFESTESMSLPFSFLLLSSVTTWDSDEVGVASSTFLLVLLRSISPPAPRLPPKPQTPISSTHIIILSLPNHNIKTQPNPPLRISTTKNKIKTKKQKSPKPNNSITQSPKPQIPISSTQTIILFLFLFLSTSPPQHIKPTKTQPNPTLRSSTKTTQVPQTQQPFFPDLQSNTNPAPAKSVHPPLSRSLSLSCTVSIDHRGAQLPYLLTYFLLQ